MRTSSGEFVASFGIVDSLERFRQIVAPTQSKPGTVLDRFIKRGFPPHKSKRVVVALHYSLFPGIVLHARGVCERNRFLVAGIKWGRFPRAISKGNCDRQA